MYGVASRDGGILLARLTGSGRWGGRWTLPGGGMEWGESPEDALTREIWEETGTAVVSAEPLSAESYMVDSSTDHGRVHVLAILFRVSLTGEIRPESGGSTDQAAWHPTGALPEVVPLVDRAVALVGAA